MFKSPTHQFSTEKLRVKLTKDEIIFYNNIYNKLEKNEEGRIPSKIVINFMKTSGLDKNILKKIFLIACNFVDSQLDKEDLFVILRLIALAQNNLSFTAENIKKNDPLPPLPKFSSCIKIVKIILIIKMGLIAPIITYLLMRLILMIIINRILYLIYLIERKYIIKVFLIKEKKQILKKLVLVMQ